MQIYSPGHQTKKGYYTIIRSIFHWSIFTATDNISTVKAKQTEQEILRESHDRKKNSAHLKILSTLFATSFFVIYLPSFYRT